MTGYLSSVRLPKSPNLSDDQVRRLIASAQSGDRNARDELLKANLRLVMSIVQKFSIHEFEPDDLFQIGSIGLLKAIDRFDLTYDVKLITYAVPFIIGEIKRYLRDSGPIKVSRKLKQIASKANSARNEFIKNHGREPTITELSNVTNIERSEIIEALDACRDPVSIHEPVYKNDSDDLSLMDSIASEEDSSEIIDRMALAQALKKLDDRSKKIIILRFFREKTQIEVASMLGLSQVHISRLEKQMLERLRSQLA